MNAMTTATEQSVLSKLGALSPQQLAEVEDFIEFLARKRARSEAFDRFLAVAPALEAAGLTMSESEVAAEIAAARAERRAAR
jgi:hypothetical protein